MADCSKLSKLITEYAMIVGSQDNVKNLDDVISEMETHFPDIRRESIVEAIVEATTHEAKETDELSKKLQEIKQQAHTEKSLTESIAELENYIETGEPPARIAKEIKETTQTIKDLRKARDELKERLTGEDLVKRNKTNKQIKDLEKKINDLQGHLDAGSLPPTKTRPKRGTGPIDVLRDIRDELKKQLNKSEPAQQERIEKQIKALEEKIRTGDIMPKSRIKVIPESKVLERAMYERDLLRDQIRNQIYALKPKTFWGTFADTWDVVRLTLTTGEFSLVGRQGGWYVAGHWIKGGEMIGKMFKAFADGQYAAKVNHAILNRELAPVGARAKLAIIPIDGTAKLSSQEEALMSHWAERIPVIKQFTRAGVTFMNLLRAEAFDTLYRTLGNTDSVTQEKANLFSNYVNVASGRGNLGKAEYFATFLNRVFFAPKYVVSRFQLLTGQPIWHNARGVEGSAQARKLIAIEYARSIAGISTFMALGIMAGADVEWDPRSTDFMKLRWGKTRVDPMMGLSQATVLLTRVIGGETKTGKGKIVPLRGPDVPFGGSNTRDVISRFLWYKLSPMISQPISYLAGEDPIGQPVDAAWLARNSMTPITWNDIYDVMIEQGVEKGTVISLLAMFGMGLQTYQDRKSPGAAIEVKKITIGN